MGLLTGVEALMSKYLIINSKSACFTTFSVLKYGAKWYVLALLGANFGKFSANRLA